MREDHPTGGHPLVEKLKTVLGALVDIHINVNEGEPPVLDGTGGLRKQTLVDVDVVILRQPLPHCFDRCHKHVLRKSDVDVSFAGQPVKRVEKVKMFIALRLAYQLGCGPFVDAHLRIVPRNSNLTHR